MATSSSIPSRRLISCRPARGRRHRAGGGDDRREADGRGRLERHADDEHEEGHEEDAAAQAEEGAEEAGDAAERHGGEDENRREDGHRLPKDDRTGRACRTTPAIYEDGRRR